MAKRLVSVRRGLLTILGGNVGAQLVGFATLPILSRLFTPEEFGFFALVLATVGVVGPLATLRLESATLLAENDSEVRAVVWSAIASSIVVCAVTAIVVQGLMMADVAGMASFPRITFWAPTLVFLTAFFALFTQLALRDQSYGIVAKRTLLRSIATAVPQLLFGIFLRGWDGLLVGTAVGNTTAAVAMTPQITRYLGLPRQGGMRRAWRKYWRFPVVFTPSALLNSFGAQLPLIFLTMHFGLATGGQLGMAERIVGVPVAVIGFAVSQVLQAEVADILRQRADGVLRVYLRHSLLLGSLGLLAGIGFAVLGGWLIPFVLGDDWELAGQMVQVLAVMGGIRLVASSLSSVLVLLEKSAATLILDLFRVSAVLAAIWFVVEWESDVLGAMWLLYGALSLVYLATWVVGLIYCVSYSRRIDGHFRISLSQDHGTKP